MEMFCVPSRIWSAQLERLYDRGFLLILYLYTLYHVSRLLCLDVVMSIGALSGSEILHTVMYNFIQIHEAFGTRISWKEYR